jgi:hypothetical protein
VPAELHWDRERPQFTLRAKWLAFIVQFTQETLVVNVELSGPAKWLVTKKNRQDAVAFIESLANRLDL